MAEALKTTITRLQLDLVYVVSVLGSPSKPHLSFHNLWITRRAERHGALYLAPENNEGFQPLLSMSATCCHIKPYSCTVICANRGSLTGSGIVPRRPQPRTCVPLCAVGDKRGSPCDVVVEGDSRGVGPSRVSSYQSDRALLHLSPRRRTKVSEGMIPGA